MKHSSTISSKGQITVPQEIRKRLGLSVGDRVEFLIEGVHTIIQPVRNSSNPFEKYQGALGTFPGGEKGIQSWVREMRDDIPGEGFSKKSRKSK